MANNKKKEISSNRKKNNTNNKEAKKIENVKSNDSDKIPNILLVTAGILLVFSIFYGVSVFITRDSREKNNDQEQETSISYYNILLGSSFNKKSEDYYVIYYDMSDEEIYSTYSSYVSTYRTNGDLSLYMVDMSSEFNKAYVSDTSNREATNASELKINGPTLIKFSDGKIAEYYEGDTEISGVLSN